MKSIHRLPSVLAVIVVALLVTLPARANQAYEWTGGAVGFSGTIVLNSDFNASGSISDVVSLTFTTPGFGTESFTSADLFIAGGIFSWNPYQITNMWIDVIGQPEGVGQNYSGTGFNFLGHGGSIDYSGSWLATASVPDNGLTVVLLGSAVFALAKIRRRGAR